MSIRAKYPPSRALPVPPGSDAVVCLRSDIIASYLASAGPRGRLIAAEFSRSRLPWAEFAARLPADDRHFAAQVLARYAPR